MVLEPLTPHAHRGRKRVQFIFGVSEEMATLGPATWPERGTSTNLVYMNHQRSIHLGKCPMQRREMRGRSPHFVIMPSTMRIRSTLVRK